MSEYLVHLHMFLPPQVTPWQAGHRPTVGTLLRPGHGQMLYLSEMNSSSFIRNNFTFFVVISFISSGVNMSHHKQPANNGSKFVFANKLCNESKQAGQTNHQQHLPSQKLPSVELDEASALEAHFQQNKPYLKGG